MQLYDLKKELIAVYKTSVCFFSCQIQNSVELEKGKRDSVIQQIHNFNDELQRLHTEKEVLVLIMEVL